MMWYYLNVQFRGQRVKAPWSLKMGQIGCLETSLTNNHRRATFQYGEELMKIYPLYFVLTILDKLKIVGEKVRLLYRNLYN